MTAPTTTAREVALRHYGQRASLVGAAGEVAGKMWSEVNPADIAASWARQIPELTAVVSGAQLGAARMADGYLDDVLDAQDLDTEALALINPRGFAGVASDGRGLASLLSNPAIVTLLAISDGRDIAHALAAGRANLDMLVRTQVADAGREADQVALITRPASTGYVRVAVGASCARCLLLAGRTYAWNQGFQRHPRCDCIHLPTAVARAGRLTQSPRSLYDAMTATQRTRAGFSLADQRAIADGANLSQVVNAKRGMYTAGGRKFTRDSATKRGVASRRARLTPEQIYRDAASRDDALRLLHQHGYLAKAPAPMRAAPPTPAITDPALKMTIAQIKAAAQAAGVRLSLSGMRKADLVANLRTWEIGNRRIPGLPEWKPPRAPRPGFGNVAPLGVPSPSSPVLSGALRTNDWSDEFRSILGPTVDTPVEGFRVNDLQVVRSQGPGIPSYAAASGTAWRFDGVSYLVEHGPSDFGAPWVSRALADLRSIHAGIPAASKANHAYAVARGANPADDYWRQRFNNPGHVSAAIAGDGRITIWKFDPNVSRIDNLRDSLRHETGHNLDGSISSGVLRSRSPEWAAAADADALTAARITDLQPTHPQARGLATVQPGRDWPKGVTDYGRSSSGEDFAESVMLYQLGPIATGRLPGVALPDLTGVRFPPNVVGVVTNAEVLYFRDIYPRRAAILDKIFPDIAKTQKAEVAALRASVAAPTPTPAQVRKITVDEARKAAELVTETLRSLAAGVSVPTLRASVTATANRLGTTDKTREALLKAITTAGGIAKIRTAVSRVAKGAGLRATGGTVGRATKFNSATHRSAAGKIRAGARVEILQPGYSITINGETIQITKAVVKEAPLSTAATVAKGDFVGLRRTGQQLGANPGGTFEASDGSRWYVKAARSEEHAKSEALALALYRAAGLDAPEMVVGRGVADLGGGAQVATRIVPDAKVDLRARLAEYSYLVKVREGFAADAWLANWDVAGANPAGGWDNIVSVAGSPWRIEAGGALRFRGLGELKGSAFGPTVHELATLRDVVRADRAALLFKDITPAQLRGSTERIRAITPARIRQLVRKHGLDTELADLLVARRADLIRQVDAQLRPMSVAAFSRNLKMAATDEAALASAPLGSSGGIAPDYRGFERLNTTEEGRIKDAIRHYSGNGFEDINIVLRGGHEGYDIDELARINAHIDGLDKAMAGSALRDQVVTWRGVDGESIFGSSSTWPTNLTGYAWRDDAYVSTSVEQGIATDFGGGSISRGGVLLRLLVPKGSKAIQLSDHTYESELLLGRGATYRVVRDRGYARGAGTFEGRPLGLRVLDVEVVPPAIAPA